MVRVCTTNMPGFEERAEFAHLPNNYVAVEVQNHDSTKALIKAMLNDSTCIVTHLAGFHFSNVFIHLSICNAKERHCHIRLSAGRTSCR